MVDEIAPAEENVVVVRHGHHPLRTAAKWIGIVLGVLLLLVAGIYFGLNTELGRRYVVRQINNLEMASGLDIDIQSIEGSIYGELRVRGLTLKDPKGTFFYAPVAEMEWRPFAFIRNHVDIEELNIPQARLWRAPELRSSGDPNAPLLPDLDIDIGRFSVGRLHIDPAITGQRHLLSLEGKTKISDGRAQVTLNAGAIAAPGIAGGDKLALVLDAVPDQNRFNVRLAVQAPGNGFVAGMTGVRQPLNALVAGRGSWANWQGRAQAMLGGKPLADLAIAGRDGTFTVNGPARPAILLAGPAQKLLSPLVQVNLTTTLANRRADTRLRLNSAALALAAEGMIDMGQSRFENLKVAGRLLQPNAIAPGLRARDLRVAMVLNGGFGTPAVAYDLTAASVGFEETVVEGLRATGRATVGTDRMVIPVSARARRISGLGESVGQLLTNVSLDGSFAVSGTRLLSDNLRIRSDRLNGTAIIVADLARGQYRAGLQGRINNYLVRGIGLLDITSDMNVVSEASGFGMRGRVAVRTRRIDNESAREFLGGNAVIAADIRMNPAGVISFDRLRVAAPQLTISSGRGTYNPNGRINVQATGVSKAYGAFTVAITGTTTQPQIRLRAANPGFGIGLANVEAEVRSTGRGYAITARGDSQYGPFTADVVILSGRGPMAIEIRRLVFAGITFTGRVVQTAAGPFAGTLNMNGAGLDGVVHLSAAGRVQRAQIMARADAAQIPGNPPILIQRGLINATATLYPNAPEVVGDVQIAGLRQGDLLVRTARARVNYQGGRGQAQIVAEGSRGVPFRIASNVALAPDLIRAAAQGSINRIDFRLARPAEIRKIPAGWQLQPVRVILPQGNILLAGRFGNGTVVQSRLEGLDLSIFNAFAPPLGLGGRASGSIDFTQPSGAAFPRADARLNIENFTRTGIAAVSDPVNVAMVGALRPEGGSAAAVIRRGGNVIGRAQVRLQPLGPGSGSWMTRLMAAPLSGGVRYNGPAQVLWSLAGMTEQQLSGPIGVAADFTGRVQDPQFTGVVRANNLTFEDENYGTRITNLALQGRFTSSRFELTQLSGRAGPGTVTGQGFVGLASDAGFPMDLRFNFNNAQLARSDAIGATVTGEVAVTNDRRAGGRISGDLELPEVRYQIVRSGAAEVRNLDGVRRKGEPLRSPAEMVGQEEEAGVPSIWNLDLRVRADNRVFISGMGLESEWSTNLRIEGTSATPRILGEAEIIRGTYSFSGQRFEVTTGNVAFTGARPPNPRLNIVASGEVDDVTININVSGSALNPQIAFTSNPGLPQDEIMSRLLFGGSVTELSALQVAQLGMSLNSLRGGGGGLDPLGKLRSATGAARLRVLGADEATGRGTAVAAGFYLGNDIYLELITDARGFTATQLEIALSKSLSILSQAGSFGGSNVSVRYRKRY